ncbi:alpha-E domain-containing protein [Synechococcus lacustris Tous-12m]
MLSRVAEQLYWIFRYVERAENLARFLDVSMSMALDSPAGVMRCGCR